MKLKSIIGIILIIASVAGMYLWETRFRDKLILTEVAVAKTDLKEGQIVSASDFKTVSVTRDSLIQGALSKDELKSLDGKVCMENLKAKAQVSSDMFADADSLNPEGSYTFVIPEKWIYLKNSELKAGDWVILYQMPDKENLGRFMVKMIDEEDDKFIEIQASLEDYFKILESLGKDGSLLVVSEKSL